MGGKDDVGIPGQLRGVRREVVFGIASPLVHRIVKKVG